ncbi:type VII toxin-antitoxin system MntA family adenylyltransferase antitoxin [Methanogenium organophilum]|uniref:Nucleotidyltransferase domain-containing protein n=1 Tax=Methanogenium organophilum TaxID=2199 RepID=A0A9X9T862_METOG|nr:nucleotidyltransferase domain-containing protein [Methanogenium organophilum]WAI01824.1 nucleotidyltransferase domain-containing protein [Methanogenium organophilum]
MKPKEEDIRHALRELRTLAGFENVRFIILFGSVAEGRATETSDIDLCIYYAGTPEEGQQFRFAAQTLLCDDRYDVQIFANLPLYVQKEVLRGRVLYCPDERFLYDIALETIREYDDFRHRLDDYLGVRAIG